MGQVRDYEALIRELLAGVAGGWSYGGVMGWLIGKGVKDRELAQWLGENGAALGADAEVRGQLGCLAGLGRGELAEVAGELVKGWEPEVEESKEWFDRGNELFELGRYEEAIASYDRAIEFKPDYHQAWSNRGNALYKFGQYVDAISSYERAIEFKPDHLEAWFSRGVVLGNLGQYAEAISSYDRAIEINPDYHAAWSNRGIALRNLGRYEEAIFSYERAIEIKPDYHATWSNRGIALGNLGRYEEEIASYERAIEINPDYHAAWFNRGEVLSNLGRYEEAISTYERAIEIKPDYNEAWYNRGVVLGNLGRHEEAISSYESAIEINPDDHKCWFNRCIEIGILHGYQAKITAYHQAFKHIHIDTDPEGWGYLQHRIGHSHYLEGRNQLLNYRKNPQPYYHQALTSYHNALQTLTREEFPKLRIETLIDTAQVHLAQNNTPTAHECQIEALDILRDLLNGEPTFAGKKQLQIEYVSLSQLDVDLFVASGENIRALQSAELDKNNHLTWLLSALAETTISPSYDQMPQLLATAPRDRKTGIVYWHLSPDNLTTFILHPHKAEPEALSIPSLHLQNWLKTYDSDNLDAADWQELANILQISEINRHLDGINHLILIPHRDLHRLPLHIYWQNLTTTYLPSIQIGLNLQAKPQPNLAAGLLLIEAPAYHAATNQTRQDKPLGILPNAEIEAAILEYLLQPKTMIRSGSVSNDRLQTDLNRPHYYGHFNGHAYHDARRPQDSSLILDGDDVLACADLAAIDLQPYHLISLSACQTGVTTHQTIDTEYVGLVSAFLSRGTNYVVSTLWSVADLPSSLLMMVFYIYIKKGIPAPLALRQAASWLRNLTYAKEAEFHGNIYQRLDPKSSTARSVDRNRQNALAAAQQQPEAKPYSNPKYWAAFTISGWG